MSYGQTIAKKRPNSTAGIFLIDIKVLISNKFVNFQYVKMIYEEKKSLHIENFRRSYADKRGTLLTVVRRPSIL